MADIPTNEPLELVAGDRWQWRREDLTDYPASSSWELSYHFTNASHTFSIDAAADGDHFAVDKAPADTAALNAGTYKWAAYVKLSTTDRQQVDTGTLVVQPNLEGASASDQRTHAEKVLDAIEAVIEGRASKDQASYSIEGRSLSRTPIDELLRLRATYRAEVNQHRNKERADAGLGRRSKIKTRFV